MYICKLLSIAKIDRTTLPTPYLYTCMCVCLMGLLAQWNYEIQILIKIIIKPDLFIICSLVYCSSSTEEIQGWCKFYMFLLKAVPVLASQSDTRVELLLKLKKITLDTSYKFIATALKLCLPMNY